MRSIICTPEESNMCPASAWIRKLMRRMPSSVKKQENHSDFRIPRQWCFPSEGSTATKITKPRYGRPPTASESIRKRRYGFSSPETDGCAGDWKRSPERLAWNHTYAFSDTEPISRRSCVPPTSTYICPKRRACRGRSWRRWHADCPWSPRTRAAAVIFCMVRRLPSFTPLIIAPSARRSPRSPKIRNGEKSWARKTESASGRFRLTTHLQKWTGSTAPRWKNRYGCSMCSAAANFTERSTSSVTSSKDSAGTRT